MAKTPKISPMYQYEILTQSAKLATCQKNHKFFQNITLLSFLLKRLEESHVLLENISKAL